MSVISLLERVEEWNIRLVVEGEHLRYRAPRGALTADIRKDLKDHKAEVMAIIQDEKVSTRRYGPEVLRRAAMFREHLSKPGPVKYFEMPGATMREGYCLTCGEEPPVGRHDHRCRICGQAARLSYRESNA